MEKQVVKAMGVAALAILMLVTFAQMSVSAKSSDNELTRSQAVGTSRPW